MSGADAGMLPTNLKSGEPDDMLRPFAQPYRAGSYATMNRWDNLWVR